MRKQRETLIFLDCISAHEEDQAGLLNSTCTVDLFQDWPHCLLASPTQPQTFQVMLTLFLLVLSRVCWARQVTDPLRGQFGNGAKAASAADAGRGPVCSRGCRVRGHHSFSGRAAWLLCAALSSFPRPPAVLAFPPLTLTPFQVLSESAFF